MNIQLSDRMFSTVRVMWNPFARLFGVREVWTIEGLDTFAGERYAYPGQFRSRERAVAAARQKLRALERYQPSKVSGGQDGIQDRVFVVAPDGRRFRVLP